MAQSEVAIFREQQALREEAAREGLYGLAMVARREGSPLSEAKGSLDTPVLRRAAPSPRSG